MSESNVSTFTFEVFDRSFAEMLGQFPRLALVGSGFGFADRPVYMTAGEALGYLYVSDFTNNDIRVMIYNVPYAFSLPITLRQGSSGAPAGMGFPAGMAANEAGELIVCTSTEHRLVKVDAHGKLQSFVSEYQGKPLNSPNDVVVKSDGSVWFTDPPYSTFEFTSLQAELPSNVYRYDPAKSELSVVATPKESGLVMPNGLAFSPDEKILYIADSARELAAQTSYHYLPAVVVAFDVASDGKSLAMPGRAFTTPLESGVIPDGLCCDTAGNLFVTTAIGVQVVSPQGTVLGLIRTPQYAGNCAFGGPDNDILFITATSSVWGIRLKAKGAVPVRRIGPVLGSPLPDFFSGSRVGTIVAMG